MTKKELDHRRYIRIKATPEYKKRNARGTRKWVSAHANQAAALKKKWAHGPGIFSAAGYRVRLKIECLTHYGHGKLQCRWPGCEVNDVDMLSLDHENNDGAQDRRKNGSRGGGGIATYQRLRKAGYPPGFQTLCHNHQWKKELMRRRERNV